MGFIKITEVHSVDCALQKILREICKIAVLIECFSYFQNLLWAYKTRKIQSQCKFLYVAKKKKKKSEFWRAPCFIKFSTTTVRQQRMLSLCPPHLPEDGSLHFKTCCKSSTERTWKMRNKAETDKSHLNSESSTWKKKTTLHYIIEVKLCKNPECCKIWRV